MSYKQRNNTRLKNAQKIATEHLGRLPAGSHVAVSDTASDLPLVFQAEQLGAIDRIEKLQPHAVSLSLADRIRAALRCRRTTTNGPWQRRIPSPKTGGGTVTARDLCLYRPDGLGLASGRFQIAEGGAGSPHDGAALHH